MPVRVWNLLNVVCGLMLFVIPVATDCLKRYELVSETDTACLRCHMMESPSIEPPSLSSCLIFFDLDPGTLDRHTAIFNSTVNVRII